LVLIHILNVLHIILQPVNVVCCFFRDELPATLTHRRTLKGSTHANRHLNNTIIAGAPAGDIKTVEGNMYSTRLYRFQGILKASEHTTVWWLVQQPIIMMLS
jgi:hypothetical protein